MRRFLRGGGKGGGGCFKRSYKVRDYEGDLSGIVYTVDDCGV